MSATRIRKMRIIMYWCWWFSGARLLVQGFGVTTTMHSSPVSLVSLFRRINPISQRQRQRRPMYLSALASNTNGEINDPVQQILNRAVLLYDQLAYLERSTVNQYLSEQLTTMIVSMARHLRQPGNDGSSNSSRMNQEQVQLLTAILDTIESQIRQQQQTTAARLASNDLDGWRVLHQAAQLIEKAIVAKVPYQQVRPLVESYAAVKASLEQEQISRQANQQASIVELWQKIAPFVPSSSLVEKEDKPAPSSSPPNKAPKRPPRAKPKKPPSNPIQSQSPPPPVVSTTSSNDSEKIAQQMPDWLQQQGPDNVRPMQRQVDAPRVSPPPPPAPPTVNPSPAVMSSSFFNDPSVQERNRLAKQLEEALLSDMESSDPVQMFVDSLQSKTAPPSIVKPSSSNSTTPPNKPVSSPSVNPPVFTQTSAVQKQNEMAQRLEAALLADKDDDNTSPVESFLASLKQPSAQSSTTEFSQSVDLSLLPRAEDSSSYKERIESFVQDLRQIRNVDYTSSSREQEPRPPPIKPAVVRTQELGQEQFGFTEDQSTSEQNQSEVAAPFYFANLTATEFFADTVPPADEESAKREIKIMERNMITYLEATRPAVERTREFARAFANTATPLVEKGVSMAKSGLDSAWVALSSAAKTTAERALEEQVKIQADANSNPLSSVENEGGPWGPVQSVLANMRSSIENSQLNLPFLQKIVQPERVASSSSNMVSRMKDTCKEELQTDSASETNRVETALSNSDPELDENDEHVDSLDIRSEAQGDTYTSADFVDSTEFLSQPTSNVENEGESATQFQFSMEQLALEWIQMNRGIRTDQSKGLSFEVFGDSDGITIKESETLGNEATKRASLVGDPGEMTLSDDAELYNSLDSIDALPNSRDSSEILEIDRIRVLKAKLGYQVEESISNSKYDLDSSPPVDPKELQDRLAALRTKLSPSDTDSSYSATGFYSDSFNSASIVPSSSFPSSIANAQATNSERYIPKSDGSTRPKLTELASAWKKLDSQKGKDNAVAAETGSEVLQSPVSISRTSDTTDRMAQPPAAASSSWRDLAAEWKQLNGGIETENDTENSLNEKTLSVNTDDSYERSREIPSSPTSPSWTDLAREWMDLTGEQSERAHGKIDEEVPKDQHYNQYERLAKEWTLRNRDSG